MPLLGVVILVAGVSLLLRLYAHRQALAALHADAGRIARQQERLLNSELQRFRLLPIVLVEYPDLGEALRGGGGRRGGAAQCEAARTRRADGRAGHLCDRS